MPVTITLGGPSGAGMALRSLLQSGAARSDAARIAAEAKAQRQRAISEAASQAGASMQRSLLGILELEQRREREQQQAAQRWQEILFRAGQAEARAIDTGDREEFGMSTREITAIGQAEGLSDLDTTRAFLRTMEPYHPPAVIQELSQIDNDMIAVSSAEELTDEQRGTELSRLLQRRNQLVATGQRWRPKTEPTVEELIKTHTGRNEDGREWYKEFRNNRWGVRPIQEERGATGAVPADIREAATNLTQSQVRQLWEDARQTLMAERGIAENDPVSLQMARDEGRLPTEAEISQRAVALFTQRHQALTGLRAKVADGAAGAPLPGAEGGLYRDMLTYGQQVRGQMMTPTPSDAGQSIPARPTQPATISPPSELPFGPTGPTFDTSLGPQAVMPEAVHPWPVPLGTLGQPAQFQDGGLYRHPDGHTYRAVVEGDRLMFEFVR